MKNYKSFKIVIKVISTVCEVVAAACAVFACYYLWTLMPIVD